MTEAQSPAATNPLSRWAQRAPLTVFLTGTFVWAWAFWGYWIPTMPPTGLVVTPPFVLTAIAGGFGPSLAAILTSWLIGGRAEAGRLLGGIANWRMPPLNYVLALGLFPATILVSVVLQQMFLGPLKPADPSIIAVALIWPLMAALGEEFGWRGFLFPRLAKPYGFVGAALIVGILWGFWHLPADYIGLKGFGDLFWPAFLVNGPFVLTGHALVMAWLWRRSGGNLLLMVLYHLSVTATAMVAPAAGGQDWVGLASASLSAVLVWLVAIILWTRFTPRRP